MNNTSVKIDKWFPKSVYIAENLLTESEISSIEFLIKDIYERKPWAGGVNRTELQQVDSLHMKYDVLHLEDGFKPFVNKLLPHIFDYLTALGYSEGFISKLKITNMWSNISYGGDYVTPHHHSGSLISGAFYIKSPAGSNIRFYNDKNMAHPPQNFTELSYEYCKYECIPSRLLLFKSDFVHGTDRQADGEKIVISFNIS